MTEPATPAERVDRAASTRRRALTPVLAGLAALCLLLSAFTGTAAAKAPKEFYGIVGGGPLTSTDLKRMHNSKVRTVRFLLSWANVEPRKGVYKWPDGLIAAFAQHGIRAEPRLTGTPRWATGSNDTRKPPIRGKAKRGWAKFVRKAVNRYEPGGSFWREHPTLPATPVENWQVWNEPNLKKEWPPNASAKTYAKLLKRTDKVINRSDRHARVLLAGLSGSTHGNKAVRFSHFLDKLYKVRGIKHHFDAAAFHPYGPTIKAVKKRIKSFRSVMKKHHDKRTPLWITELGYGSGPKDKFGLNRGSARAQATALSRSFRLILHDRRKWRIRKLDWYDWRDPIHPSQRAFCSFCPYAGLLRGSGKPKPAYHRFRAFTKRAR